MVVVNEWKAESEKWKSFQTHLYIRGNWMFYINSVWLINSTDAVTEEIMEAERG